MKIKFLGTSNAESSKTRMVSLLIDNILAIDAGSLTSALTFTEQKKIKAILLTHGHYDHIRDIPAFAFNNSFHQTKILANIETTKILTSHLLDGVIYPRFAGKTPFLKKPALQLLTLKPFKPRKLGGYQITAVPVNHPNWAVGFAVSDKGGKSFFYTGDTGLGLADVWECISPDVLIVDLTYPNRMSKAALDARHLCTEFLEKELRDFRQIKGYLPRVVAIHLTPRFKGEIRKEAEKMATELDIDFKIAADGEEIILGNVRTRKDWNHPEQRSIK